MRNANFSFVVVNKHNGYRVTYNSKNLAVALENLLNLNTKDYHRMAQNSFKISKKYTWNQEKRNLNVFIYNLLHNNKKILFLAYFYPPLGGPAVQRPCKFIHYLRKKGILSDVITVEDIIYHSYDEKLQNECEENNCYPVVSLDPMRLLKKTVKDSDKKSEKIYFKTPEKFKRIIRGLFPIDDKIGWLPFAFLKSAKLLIKNNYLAIMATMGPYTSGVTAYLLSKIFGKPLILDYRDHWSLNRYPRYSLKVLKIISHFIEKRMVHHAKLITIVGAVMKNELANEFNIDENKILTMYNGWDEKDFSNLKILPKTSDNYLISYIGNFYGNRTIIYFIKALKQLVRENKIPNKVKFRFIGNYFSGTLKLLNSEILKPFIEVKNQVDHKKALEYLVNSDALLLFIASKNGKGFLTGKLFEYIRSQKPILAMIPEDGEAEEILRNSKNNYITQMENTDGIKEQIIGLINDLKNEKTPKIGFDDEFSREKQTEKFINEFENIIKDE